jgi:putative ABC transport system ATP-binding protein
VSPDGVGIEVVDLTKQYRTPGGVVRALDGISLHVGPGESVAVVGPSGCGKSTLLGLIAGLDTPTSGTVTIGAQQVSSMDDEERAHLRRRDIGLVFQSDDLLPFLTATENVSAQLALADGNGAHADSVDILVGAGLADEIDKLPDQLSGGQRQRIAVARAIVHRPRVIVADEPTGSLDPDNAMAVVDLLLEAQRATGATLVLVTHEEAVAARLERTVALRDGRLADGATDQPSPGSPS